MYATEKEEKSADTATGMAKATALAVTDQERMKMRSALTAEEAAKSPASIVMEKEAENAVHVTDQEIKSAGIATADR